MTHPQSESQPDGTTPAVSVAGVLQLDLFHMSPATRSAYCPLSPLWSVTVRKTPMSAPPPSSVLQRLFPAPVMIPTPAPLAALGGTPTSPAIPRWKRALDLACCLVALPAFALCSLAATIWVSIFSPGPVLFFQERVGYRGRRFKLYKLRTMHCRSASCTHETHFTRLMHSDVPMQKLDGQKDSRIFPGGWFLRASGLDELPQIINVLRGDMSIVGPRPCIPYEYDQYSTWQRQRTHTLPGLTGLWQVSGKNRTTFKEMIRLDIAYAEKKSPWLDVKIILGTVPALLRQILDTRRQRKLAGTPTPLTTSAAGPTSATNPSESPARNRAA
jgi:lipopolysaccharide/colanic/teichoic acid biosynthesis glycosyltransferase